MLGDWARKVLGARSRETPPPAQEPDGPVRTEYLLRAYELAQRHYDSDLQLFSARMNLFLLVQSALVAVTGGSILGGSGRPADYLGAVAVFGLVLAVGWLLVAVSSYAWVKTWRANMITIGTRLRKVTGVPFSSGQFDRVTRQSMYPKDAFWSLIEAFSWAVRPTLVTCCLPLLFIGGWIYLGFHAHWSGI